MAAYWHFIRKINVAIVPSFHWKVVATLVHWSVFGLAIARFLGVSGTWVG